MFETPHTVCLSPRRSGRGTRRGKGRRDKDERRLRTPLRKEPAAAAQLAHSHHGGGGWAGRLGWLALTCSRREGGFTFTLTLPLRSPGLQSGRRGPGGPGARPLDLRHRDTSRVTKEKANQCHEPASDPGETRQRAKKPPGGPGPLPPSAKPHPATCSID